MAPRRPAPDAGRFAARLDGRPVESFRWTLTRLFTQPLHNLGRNWAKRALHSGDNDHPDSYADRHPDSVPFPNPHSDPHTDADFYADSHTNRHTDGDRHSLPHTNRHTDDNLHSISDANPQANGHIHSVSHTDLPSTHVDWRTGYRLRCDAQMGLVRGVGRRRVFCREDWDRSSS
jgi:hypothetical protein